MLHQLEPSLIINCTLKSVSMMVCVLTCVLEAQSHFGEVEWAGS